MSTVLTGENVSGSAEVESSGSTDKRDQFRPIRSYAVNRSGKRCSEAYGFTSILPVWATTRRAILIHSNDSLLECILEPSPSCPSRRASASPLRDPGVPSRHRLTGHTLLRGQPMHRTHSTRPCARGPSLPGWSSPIRCPIRCTAYSQNVPEAEASSICPNRTATTRASAPRVPPRQELYKGSITAVSCRVRLAT